LVNPYRYAASVDPIAKDSQANDDTASSGTTLSVSLAVADNPNRALICCTSCYNPEPESTACTFGSQNFVKVGTALNPPSNGRADMWVLVNPTVSTNDVQVTWGVTMGKRGMGCYCFYNVDQADPIGVTDSAYSGSQQSTVTASITPTTEGSMIVDALSWILGGSYNARPVSTLTDGWYNIYSGGKTGASQYDLDPTIDSTNTMGWTSLDDNGSTLEAAWWATFMAEVKNG